MTFIVTVFCPGEVVVGDICVRSNPVVVGMVVEEEREDTVLTPVGEAIGVALDVLGTVVEDLPF